MTNRLVPVSTDLRRHSVIYMLQLFPFTLLVYGVLMDPHVAFTHSIWVVNTDFPGWNPGWTMGLSVFFKLHHKTLA